MSRPRDWKGAEATVRRALRLAGDAGVLQSDLKSYLGQYRNRSEAASRSVQTLMRWGVARREPEGPTFRVYRIKNSGES